MSSLIDEDLSRPGTHALVIGVSAYDHLQGGKSPSPQGQEMGLKQLSAAARSASDFAAWLLEDYKREHRPLSSLRVLLSESPAESINPTIKAKLRGDSRATSENVNKAFDDFRAAADTHRENVAIVYVAGHGIQFSKSGAVLLLNDFASPLHRYKKYAGAIDMRSMHNSMNNESTAQTQFWFVDACRDLASDAGSYSQLGGLITHDVGTSGFAQTSPLFLSASSGQAAYAKPNEQTIFCEALIRGLKEGFAARSEGERNSPWRVSVNTLIEYLPTAIQSILGSVGEDQLIECTGRINNAIFHEYNKVPNVNLKISIRDGLDKSNYTANIKHRGLVKHPNYSAWPFEKIVPAGLYSIEVTTISPPGTDEDCLNVQPPSSEKEIPLES